MIPKAIAVVRLFRVVGTTLDIVGILWILQGTNIVQTGFMAGHLQYAALGIAAFIVGTGLLVLTYRRPGHTPAKG